MKITEKKLRRLVTEEITRSRRKFVFESVIRRLNELYPGSNVGSWLKQAVSKIWEADNLFTKALSEAPDDATWNAINDVHQMLEKLGFELDGKVEKLISSDVKNHNHNKIKVH